MTIFLAVLHASIALILTGPGFERELTLEDLRAFPETRVSLPEIEGSGDGSVAGPELRAVLEGLGTDTTSIGEIVLRSSDGYRVTLFSDLLDDCRAILLFDIAGTPFAGYGPIYSVLPGCPEMLWVKDLREVEVLPESAPEPLTTIRIVTKEAVLDRARPVEMDGMTFWGLPFAEFDEARGRIEVRSRDGLGRRYSPEEISEEGWMIADYHGRGFDFIARDVPRGAWVRDIELIVHDGEAFYFPPDLEEGLSAPRRTLGDLFPDVDVLLDRIEIRTGSLLSDLDVEGSPIRLSDVVFEGTPGSPLRVVIGDAAFENVIWISFP